MIVVDGWVDRETLRLKMPLCTKKIVKYFECPYAKGNWALIRVGTT